jgi:hypothetical protein
MSGDSINRRDVLKNAVLTSSIPMASGLASATGGGNGNGNGGGRGNGNGNANGDRDVNITDMTSMSPDAVDEDVRAVVDREETRNLTSQVRDRTGFSLNDEFAVGLAIETDDQSLNAHDPRILHLPMMPKGSSLSPAGKESSGPEFSIDNGGALLAITIRDKGERAIAGLTAMTREKSQDDSLLADNSPEVTTKSFVVQEGSVEKHREEKGRKPMKSKWQSELGAQSAPVGTYGNGGFTCWGCATVVGIACAGAATLSYTTCVSAAFASSVFSPTAGAAVAAFCTYIVANAGTLSCAAGTAAICAGVTNDCQFLE